MAKKQTGVMGLVEAKRWLRKFLIRQRQGLPSGQQRALSRKIMAHLFRSRFFREAKHVAVFIGFGSEVMTQGLIKKSWSLKKDVLIPMTNEGLHRPFFAVFRRGDKLSKTKFGPLELEEKKKPFRFQKIDLVLVPGLAFDERGYRLGYGGGVYDRILALTPRAAHVGLFFEQQRVVRLPLEKHDRPLAAVVTETGVKRF